ncbi:hypothetical protein Y032_0108g1 [Ancylostoma ceylanicum]|uniref:Uncharacterized protein n=1 Tax=Ancylostoma ceylanicum TaxID=53326 RepID=A0A016TF22_9BILA|nr:hypothetical protein Y032_0108g1 [Ancylostoma ceylanicum]
MGLLSLSSDDIINIFVSGDKWCPIAIIGVKCPESTWYFTYHCCGELMSQCCMAPSIWDREPHLGPPNSPDFALSEDHLLASFKPYLREKNSKTATKPNFG